MMEYKEKILNILKYDPISYTKEELFYVGELENKKQFYSVLNEMIVSYEVMVTAKDKVMLPEHLGFYVGELEIKRKGFAFVRMDEGGDIFVSSDDIEGAFDGERVAVKLKKNKGKNRSETSRREGYVVKIIGDELPTMLGTFDKSPSFSFVVTDKQGLDDIYIKKSQTMNAKDGQKVMVQITKRAQKDKNPEGKVIEVLGFSGEKGVDVLSVIRKFRIQTRFSDQAIQEAETSANQGITKSDVKNRKDLRKKSIFTIDGADAKDLDDAVSIEKLKNGHVLLGVHIADVTHYVKKGSMLDKEAGKRATSVYLVDKVVPMLPAVLSNGVCSLNEKDDRLTLSCDMEIDSDGNIVAHEIYSSIIHSVHRMTYSDVNKILNDEKGELLEQYDDIKNDILMMQDLARILREKRNQKGSIDFDIDEAHFRTDENGKILDILPRERGEAERLIEDFMLAANKTVAEEYFWRELPFVYRVHENPDDDRLKALATFLSNFNIRLKGLNGDVRPKQLQQILDQVKGLKHEKIISKVLLRSLKKAEYSPENLGHFGLAFDYYCHFTSPIRRYPDFTIHRIIKDTIDGSINKGENKALLEEVVEVSKVSSLMERKAMEAERNVEDIKKCEYMKAFVGQEYVGVVSGVSRSAIFIELDNTVEGVLPLSSLKDDYYDFVENMYCVMGQRTRKKISMGDEIAVVLKDVNVLQTRIEFAIN